ncbi:hypothetical protein [uncultured Amphritea sp.]|uniref:hypothetical protein n=1 Tax=uncultured Amphritea sp. TaxID=981605 RepID=UPI002618B62F|nr:hypothetical protein [uncultured Amphritea sp.]
MLRINALPLFGLLFSVIASASTQVNDSAIFDQKNLYGRWNCKYAMEDANTRMKVDYDISYFADGRASGSGTLLLRMQNFPQMEYSLSNRSTWVVKAGSLILSSAEFKLVNRSHPELDQILNLESLFPQNVRESSTILELTQSTLVARSDSYGGVYSCSKRAPKI